MTAVPDHRPDRVVLACSCGAPVEKPAVAAAAPASKVKGKARTKKGGK